MHLWLRPPSFIGDDAALANPGHDAANVGQALVDAGRRVQGLDAMLERLPSQHAKRLREQFGVGLRTAAVLIAVAGDNPERLRSETALAALCGARPLQVSSRKRTRYRLNRGGDRSANNALWTIAIILMRSDPRARAYVERRTTQSMSNKEIHWCLKRYIVRALYPLILADLADSARFA